MKYCNSGMFCVVLAALSPLSYTLAIASGATARNPCATAPAVPPVPSNAKSITPSGADDTTRIQQTLSQMKTGEWLVFQPGTYFISKDLKVDVDGTTLFGSGATIHATNAADGAIMIEGDNIAVYGFTTTQDSTSRLGTPWSGGISVYDQRASKIRRVLGTIIQNNTVNNASSAGIFLYKGSRFTIANNVVYRSWADGIHMTGGSSDGRVIHNTVSQVGDDMVAVVSYAGSAYGDVAASTKYVNWSANQDELDRDIYISDNTVSDQYWGRGMSVVGGSNVTMEYNNISRTATGAGIYLTREVSYGTFGDRNILISNNQISRVQTDPPTYMPAGIVPTQSHQGGIEIAAQMETDVVSNPVFVNAFSVSNISLVSNQISNTHYDGIRLGIYSPDNAVSQVLISNNTLSSVGIPTLLGLHPGLQTATTACTGNSLEGVSQGNQCDKSLTPVTSFAAATGASLQCDSNGNLARATLAPAALKTN